MASFNSALGVECTYCHDPKDYQATTPQRTAGKKMWDLVMTQTRADGSTLYCDSCHQGSGTFLDRTDAKAVVDYMNKHMVQGLRQRDGTTQRCESCHGVPFRPDYLSSAYQPRDGGSSGP